MLDFVKVYHLTFYYIYRLHYYIYTLFNIYNNVNDARKHDFFLPRSEPSPPSVEEKTIKGYKNDNIIKMYLSVCTKPSRVLTFFSF